MQVRNLYFLFFSGTQKKTGSFLLGCEYSSFSLFTCHLLSSSGFIIAHRLQMLHLEPLVCEADLLFFFQCLENPLHYTFLCRCSYFLSLTGLLIPLCGALSDVPQVQRDCTLLPSRAL